MSRTSRKPLVDAMALAMAVALCSAAGGETAEGGGRIVLDLSGRQWQMEGIHPGRGVEEGFHEYFGEIAPSTYNWNGAEVPGDVYTDLWRAGEIDDPHFGRNGMRAKWVAEREWWYRRTFSVPESWRDRWVTLVFEGVDYACEVWLNGIHLGRHEGMFSPFEFDVGKALRYGPERRANGLAVRLDPPPRLYRNVAGTKFPWHGDYWRAIVPIGIWRPVKLMATGPVRLADVYPKSEIHPDGSATVRIEVSLRNREEVRGGKVRLRALLRPATFDGPAAEAEADVALRGLTAAAELTFRLEHPRLWWPWEFGGPDLYSVETAVFGASGEEWDRTSRRFGIRSIQMEYNPGYSRREVQHPWTVVINGKPLFLRSANWGGPPDIFYGRNSDEKYRRLIELARGANLNNLRIFGWHPPEIDLFYDLCDEFGITVWQDLLPLASVNLPRDDRFREAVYAEAAAVIRRLRRHPSLVLLEGGEEMFYGSQGLEYNARFLLGLGEVIRRYTDLPYVPTSPTNWPPAVQELGLGGPKDSAHTHALFYGLGGQLMEDYVQKWDYAAIPEFAVSSVPAVESLKKFIPAGELWPPGPSWGYHWADLDVFLALNAQVLGEERTGSLEEFVEATQIAQGTIFQFGIEHVRRRKPKSSAISICHFITYAPDMKWGIVDYFQKPKLSYEFVKRSYQPVLVTLEYPKRRWGRGERLTGAIWVVNDLDRTFSSCTVDARVEGMGGGRLFAHSYELGDVPPLSSHRYLDFEWEVETKDARAFRIALLLKDGRGEIISANHYDLLVGDQEEARRRAKERAARFHAVKEEFSRADYYRFYPELGGGRRKSRIGDAPPRAAGF